MPGPSIQRLPCEIVGAILANLDHLKSLPPALLTCRHFYTSYKESHGIEASILRRQITPALLPHAVALMEAKLLARPPVTSSVLSLLDELDSHPSFLAVWLSSLPRTMLQKMSRAHDAVHTFATDFAKAGLDRLSSHSTSARIGLSPLEYFRFCRAFYRLELFYMLPREPQLESVDRQFFF